MHETINQSCELYQIVCQPALMSNFPKHILGLLLLLLLLLFVAWKQIKSGKASLVYVHLPYNYKHIPLQLTKLVVNKEELRTRNEVLESTRIPLLPSPPSTMTMPSPQQQPPYVRARHSPCFDGLLRGHDQTTQKKIIVSDDEEVMTIEKTSYKVTRMKEKLPSVLLPLSAASYYHGISPQMEIVEYSESINKLNAYLKATKDDVNAGVPAKFLRAVIASDHADVGSVASTIMYSYYLHVTSKSEQFCTVPIINIDRANLASHVELNWLLHSSQIDHSSLIFVDEIDLSYYDLFGSLKIVLLKCNKISHKQEKLKHAVVEMFHCTKSETIYPWVKTITTGEESTCCTAIAEKFFTHSPEILAGKSISRILLAGILLDTGNLRDPHCSDKDKYTASLLINGAGRYGCNGLYQLLKYKMHDLSSLQVSDILRKDFKKWTGQESLYGIEISGESRSLSQIGMSCIGISIGQLLGHTKNPAQEITYFQSLEKLRAVIIVSGYYNEDKNFKREILVSAESVKLLESLLFFFDFNASRLPLKSLHIAGLKNETMKAYEIDKITSRKIVEHLINEFIGTSKAI